MWPPPTPCWRIVRSLFPRESWPARPTEATPQGTTFAQARTADMVFRAKLRKLEHDVRVGKLVEAELVKQRWAAIYVAIKERMLAWPNRVAPEITPLTDERQVRDTMMREARTLINDIKADVQYAR